MLTLLIMHCGQPPAKLSKCCVIHKLLMMPTKSALLVSHTSLMHQADDLSLAKEPPVSVLL